MPRESIVDTRRPSAGRIYDYLLGGHHNFEVDRQAADRLRTLLPFMPKIFRLQRWCLQDLAVELAEKRGFEVILDFASGLPTNDHIHQVVPAGTSVVYSDFDPMVVEYAHEILKGTPNVHFFQADARKPEELLERAEVKQILDGRRDVGINFWGIAIFLADDEIRHAMRVLYDWAGKESCLAFCAQGVDVGTGTGEMNETEKLYAEMGSPVYLRSLDHYLDLVRPWHPDAQGMIRLLDWHGFDESALTADDRRQFGEAAGMYGAYLVK